MHRVMTFCDRKGGGWRRAASRYGETWASLSAQCPVTSSWAKRAASEGVSRQCAALAEVSGSKGCDQRNKVLLDTGH